MKRSEIWLDMSRSRYLTLFTYPDPSQSAGRRGAGGADTPVAVPELPSKLSWGPQAPPRLRFYTELDRS